jgi:hypothetical protein
MTARSRARCRPANTHKCTSPLVPQLEIGGKAVHIGGMCKGSGMIHPNMATMLGVVTCDASVEPELWRYMLRQATDDSFNAVSAGMGACALLAAATDLQELLAGATAPHAGRGQG